MPRETKEQRLARIQKEVQELEKKRESEYLPYLMSLMERAQKHNITIRFEGDKFRLSYPDWYGDILVCIFYSSENYEELESLRYRVEDLDDKLKESIRLAELKKTALNKLTDEEKSVLGL